MYDIYIYMTGVMDNL